MYSAVASENSIFGYPISKKSQTFCMVDLHISSGIFGFKTRGTAA
nr:MAG TPA: hypothetical protein [Caudoviricetes sp.]